MPLTWDGFHNVFRLSARITSGSGPESHEAFAMLAEAGITTVVSVDGAPPHVRLARQHGLRYVHIPVGYDGLSRAAELALARVVRETKGPMYIHCHHGKHRGPAAAAVACLAEGSVDAEQATLILTMAGTSDNYRGLWRNVAAFELPQPGESLPQLVESAKVAGIVQAMSQVDLALGHLTALHANDWRPLAEHPDVAARTAAALLWEGFREAARHTRDGSHATLRQSLEVAVDDARQLRRTIEAGDFATVARQLATVESRCSECHARHRDNRN